jgi:hypothetical protein
LDLRGRKWLEAREDCIMRSFITCTLQNVIRVIKSRRMRQMGNVEGMGEMRNTIFWLDNFKGRDHLEDLAKMGRC